MSYTPNFLLQNPIIVEKSIGTHTLCAPIFLCGYVGISLDGGDFLNCEGVTP